MGVAPFGTSGRLWAAAHGNRARQGSIAPGQGRGQSQMGAKLKGTPWTWIGKERMRIRVCLVRHNSSGSDTENDLGDRALAVSTVYIYVNKA